jgi:hypothetical protein
MPTATVGVDTAVGVAIGITLFLFPELCLYFLRYADGNAVGVALFPFFELGNMPVLCNVLIEKKIQISFPTCDMTHHFNWVPF